MKAVEKIPAADVSGRQIVKPYDWVSTPVLVDIAFDHARE
jgi:hypothetical protein